MQTLDDTRAARSAIRSRERLQDPATLRRLLRTAGYSPRDLGDHLAREAAGPLVAGGATGQGGVQFLSNLPADQFRMDPALFAQSTERQDIPLPQQTFNGFGSSNSIRLQSVGVAALIRINFVGTLVVGGTGAVASLPGWPYGLLKRTAFNANGSSLIACRGDTLRARRNRIFRNPAESIFTAPGSPPATIANGTYPVSFMVDVPISHDMFSGTGWVLAQNPTTSLTVDIAIANLADMFSVVSGGTVALTGTIFSEMSTFAVGTAQAGNTSVTVVPDLTVYHGMLDNDYPFTAAGMVQAPLIRTAGQLVNYAFNLRNGPAAEIAPVALTEAQFRYGGNRSPRVYNPLSQLIESNQANYNGVINVGGLTYTYLDFEAENPVRDLFLPEALVELLAQFTIPNGVTVNGGAFVHYVEETLYPAS